MFWKSGIESLGKHVLVVDDDREITSSLSGLLRDEGFQVRVANNSLRALELLEESKPDFLILDVVMPIMTGTELLLKLQRTPGLDSIPVVLMSALPFDVDNSTHNFVEFLKKPFSIDQLLSVIKDHS
jgi:CheY-like chemotaxis protein